MNASINNMKKSAAILAFFLSASAWTAHKIAEERPVQPAEPTAQADSSNNDIVLRPLTD